MPQPGSSVCLQCRETEDGGENWDGIDDGWELVDLGDGQKRRRRTRAKGKKKTRPSAAMAQLESATPNQQQKPKKQKLHQPRADKKQEKKSRPAWLLPIIVFLIAAGVLVLAAVASKT